MGTLLKQLDCDGHAPNNDPTATSDLDKTSPKTVIKPKKAESRWLKNHPTNAIIGDITKGRITRGQKNVNYREMTGMIIMAGYTSIIEQKNFREALVDEY